MKITWEISEENARFLLLFVDDALWKEVYRQFFSKDLKLLLKSASLSELEENFLLLEEKAAKREALRLLAYRSHLSSELQEKLEQKGISSPSAEKAVQECTRLGYLDDLEKIRMMVQREQKKGYGASHIRAKLRARGIALPASLNAQLENSEVEKTAIQKILAQRLRRHALDSPQARQKVFAALKRRGFNTALILAALNDN